MSRAEGASRPRSLAPPARLPDWPTDGRRRTTRTRTRAGFSPLDASDVPKKVCLQHDSITRDRTSSLHRVARAAPRAHLPHGAPAPPPALAPARAPRGGPRARRARPVARVRAVPAASSAPAPPARRARDACDACAASAAALRDALAYEEAKLRARLGAEVRLADAADAKRAVERAVDAACGPRGRWLRYAHKTIAVAAASSSSSSSPAPDDAPASSAASSSMTTLSGPGLDAHAVPGVFDVRPERSERFERFDPNDAESTTAETLRARCREDAARVTPEGLARAYNATSAAAEDDSYSFSVDEESDDADERDALERGAAFAALVCVRGKLAAAPKLRTKVFLDTNDHLSATVDEDDGIPSPPSAAPCVAKAAGAKARALVAAARAHDARVARVAARRARSEGSRGSEGRRAAAEEEEEEEEDPLEELRRCARVDDGLRSPPPKSDVDLDEGFACVALADAFFRALFETGKPNENGDAASLSGKGGAPSEPLLSKIRAVFGGDRSESSVASAALSALARFDPSRAAETAARLALRTAAAASARETSPPEEEEEEGASRRLASAEYLSEEAEEGASSLPPRASSLARSFAASAVAFDPRDPSGHFASADVAFRSGDFQAALDGYETGVLYAPLASLKTARATERAGAAASAIAARLAGYVAALDEALVEGPQGTGASDSSGASSDYSRRRTEIRDARDRALASATTRSKAAFSHALEALVLAPTRRRHAACAAAALQRASLARALSLASPEDEDEGEGEGGDSGDDQSGGEGGASRGAFGGALAAARRAERSAALAASAAASNLAFSCDDLRPPEACHGAMLDHARRMLDAERFGLARQAAALALSAKGERTLEAKPATDVAREAEARMDAARDEAVAARAFGRRWKAKIADEGARRGARGGGARGGEL